MLAALLALGGCALPAGLMGSSDKGSAKSHGPTIHGYGAITFGMDKNRAFAAIGGRGQFQRASNGKSDVLIYDDYVDYVPVRVVQYFDDKGKAGKAEAYAGDGQRPMPLSDCQGLFQAIYVKLQHNYQAPDWAPREESRRYGRGGVLMYTFADGSHIILNYDFVTQGMFAGETGLCTVKLAVSPSSVGGGGGGDD